MTIKFTKKSKEKYYICNTIRFEVFQSRQIIIQKTEIMEKLKVYSENGRLVYYLSNDGINNSNVNYSIPSGIFVATQAECADNKNKDEEKQD